jgi:hypothetical protein
MALVTIEPTAADERIANAIASHTTPAAEEVAQLLTWGADEKVLLALAIAGWLYAARRPALQPVANHMVVVSLLSSILPHLLKSVVDQTRPDRLTVKGHWARSAFLRPPTGCFSVGATPFTWVPSLRRQASSHHRSDGSRVEWRSLCRRRAFCFWRTGPAMLWQGLRWALSSNG